MYVGAITFLESLLLLNLCINKLLISPALTIYSIKMLLTCQFISDT